MSQNVSRVIINLNENRNWKVSIKTKTSVALIFHSSPDISSYYLRRSSFLSKEDGTWKGKMETEIYQWFTLRKWYLGTGTEKKLLFLSAVYSRKQQCNQMRIEHQLHLWKPLHRLMNKRHG